MEKSKESLRVELGLDAALQLQKISTSLIPEGNIDILYGDVLDAAISLMSADMGSMQVFMPQRDELRLLVNRGFHPESEAFWEYVRIDSTCSCGLALLSGARAILPDIETCEPAIGAGDLAAYRRSGIRAVQSTPLISRSGELLGMISTHWRAPHQPTELALRTFDVLARQAADLIDRARIEEDNRWLAAIVESSNDAILSTDLDGLITSWNKSAERIYGYLAEEAIGHPILILVPPERHGEEQVLLARIRRGERVDHYETVRRRKDGSLIDVSLTISPVSADGKIVGASKIARDISERKRSEAHIAILAREAEHRAKNILATVKAAVHLSRSDTLEGLKCTIEGRIQALANVHKLFVETHWVGADVRSIVTEEMSPYGCQGDGRAKIEGPNLVVEPSVAQAIAVTMHELSTNAAKYGALSVATGCVQIEWSRLPDDRFVLRWTESGGPSVEAPASRGFGMRVMESMITAQPKGEISFSWQPRGVTCEIIMPASSA